MVVASHLPPIETGIKWKTAAEPVTSEVLQKQLRPSTGWPEQLISKDKKELALHIQRWHLWECVIFCYACANYALIWAINLFLVKTASLLWINNVKISKPQDNIYLHAGSLFIKALQTVEQDNDYINSCLTSGGGALLNNPYVPVYRIYKRTHLLRSGSQKVLLFH